MNKLIRSKVLPVVAVLVLAALAATTLVAAADNGCTATRTLPTSVQPGAQFNVGIVVADCGAMGQVRETIPAGFAYISVSDPTNIGVEQTGNEVRFTFIPGAISFTYKVQAPMAKGDYDFAGVVLDADKQSFTVGGDTTVTVEDAVSPAVGGTADPISRLPILALWTAVGAAIVAGAGLLMRRRRATR